ncbi:hypothetical protein ASC91_25790 [Pelomonas sp. Root1237]|nr:hypothetical protein ASC91_25790 [Pelomonas sp. Root1237]
MLLLVALTAAGLSTVAQSWAESARRDKEQQLLRIGALYVHALEDYRRKSPGTEKVLPMELEELVMDRRFVGTVRHIRRLYPDPVGTDGRWGVIRGDNGRIQGVHSLSADEPLIGASIERPGLQLPAARRYADWRFVVDSKR